MRRELFLDTSIPHSDEKILFVEDNPILLELYGILLEREHDQWHTALSPDGENQAYLADLGLAGRLEEWQDTAAELAAIA